MKPESLLTPAARRHIRLLFGAIQASAEPIERRFQTLLRKGGCDAAQTREILAIAPLAAAEAGRMPRFLEAVGYHGRRLARLNVALETAGEILGELVEIVHRVLKGSHAPALEQLKLVTGHALQNAYYEVRESEAQVFYGLAHAEAISGSLEELLGRIVRILTRAFGAKAGRLRMLDEPPTEPAEEVYTEEPPAGWEGYRAVWSFPVRSLAVIELGFGKPYPWLPRERSMMHAVAERCAAAIERTLLNAELSRLEAEARCAEEEERRRIGRELHDETAQALLLLRLQLEMLERESGPALRERLCESRGIAERAIVELRRTIAALSPAVLERLGLESALRQLAARFGKRHPAQVDLRITPAWSEIPLGSQEVVYRVAQESLQNICKHSRATRVNLRLSSTDKSFRLRVRDNGAGFRPGVALGKPLSFGLAGMRERAALLGGSLAVRSEPGKGAVIVLELPRAAAVRGN